MIVIQAEASMRDGVPESAAHRPRNCLGGVPPFLLDLLGCFPDDVCYSTFSASAFRHTTGPWQSGDRSCQVAPSALMKLRPRWEVALSE
jgi:hypothetical protein